MCRYENIDDDDNDNDDVFKNKEIMVTFPEKDIRISKKEYQVFSPYHENEKIMRLLTGQLCEVNSESNEVNSAAPPQQDQNDMIAKLMQNSANFQNLNGFSNMQNLMNNQALPSMGVAQPNTANTSMNNMMASMMGMGMGMNNQNPLLGMNSNLQNITQPSQMNNQNDLLLNNLMNGGSNNIPWNMAQMNAMNGNFGNLNKDSLQDLISSQMMNFNASGFMGGQDGNNQNNMGLNHQNNPYGQQNNQNK
jgi:hypothetical protein